MSSNSVLRLLQFSRLRLGDCVCGLVRFRANPAQPRRHLEGQSRGGLCRRQRPIVSPKAPARILAARWNTLRHEGAEGHPLQRRQSAGKVTETIIGTLRPPEFRSGIILDNDGESDFTLRDAKTMDVCYRHINMTSKVVACFTLEKQP